MNKVLVVFVICFNLKAQTLPSKNISSPSIHNWRLVPSKVTDPDTVDPSIRSQRDAHFDEAIGTSSPLTIETAKGRHQSEGSFWGERPEIPKVANRVIVLGEFKDWRSILSRTGRSIYTELGINILESFEDTKNFLQGKKKLTVILPGGTVERADQTVIRFLIDSPVYYLRPEENYLFVLVYHPDGAYFTLLKSWTLSGGILQATSPRERASFAQWKSTLIGVRRQDIRHALDRVLSNQR